MRPEPDVGPDDRRLGMPPQQRLHLGEEDRLLSRLGERHIHIVVDQDDEPHLAREVEDPVQGRIDQARDLARDLRGHELLVNGELADPREDARKGPQHPADVIGGVHVGGVEAGDHGIEAGLLFRRERPVGHRDDGVGERVVVERSVALQVVGRSEVAGVLVRPGLLERNAEQGRAADPRPHDAQELPDVDALLHVVGQVEVDIVEVAGARRLIRLGHCPRGDRGEEREH